MTFSVVGRCADTGRFGVACTTGSICVGARCPWVRTGVGAATTQFLTDPALGAAILDELEAGNSPDEALQAVLTSMSNEPHAQYRQVACIDAAGKTAWYTGEQVVGPAGTASGMDVVATGNLLTDAEAVPAAMVSAFESTIGQHLAARLLAALQAGEAAGGEADDCHSAVLLVTHDNPSAGWPLVNLRVDWTESSPLAELRELWRRYEPQVEDYAARAANPGSHLQLQPHPVPTKKETNSFRGHSFLLYFDKATEAALASAGERLHGMPHLGVAGRQYGYRPHISLSICGGCDLTSAAALLQQLAQSTAPFDLTLGAVGTGGSGQGLFAADGMPSLMLFPTVTSELLSLHAQLHEALIESSDVVTISPEPLYFPGAWLPHVTILQEIPEELLGEATLQTLSALPQLPMACRVETIGAITFRPGCDVVGFELGTGREVATHPTRL